MEENEIGAWTATELLKFVAVWDHTRPRVVDEGLAGLNAGSVSPDAVVSIDDPEHEPCAPLRRDRPVSFDDEVPPILDLQPKDVRNPSEWLIQKSENSTRFSSYRKIHFPDERPSEVQRAAPHASWPPSARG